MFLGAGGSKFGDKSQWAGTKTCRVSNAYEMRVSTICSVRLHIVRVREIGRMLLRRSEGFPGCLSIGVTTKCFHVWGTTPVVHALLIAVKRRIRSSSSRLRKEAQGMPCGPGSLRALTASRARSSSNSVKGDFSPSSCGGRSRS